jgi:peroxiredoxin
MLAVGSKAPDFELAGIDAEPIRLSAVAAAGPVLLAFFKVSCPVCQYTLPFLERLARSASVLGISQNERPDAAEFRRAFGITFPMAFDFAPAYTVSNAYGITHVPSLFLVEADRTVSLAGSGFSRRDLETIALRFDAALFRPDEQVPEFRPG